MGAKNHGVIMPDANREYTVNQLVGAAFGAAGQVSCSQSKYTFQGITYEPYIKKILGYGNLEIS